MTAGHPDICRCHSRAGHCGLSASGATTRGICNDCSERGIIGAHDLLCSICSAKRMNAREDAIARIDAERHARANPSLPHDWSDPYRMTGDTGRINPASYTIDALREMASELATAISYADTYCAPPAMIASMHADHLLALHAIANDDAGRLTPMTRDHQNADDEQRYDDGLARLPGESDLERERRTCTNDGLAPRKHEGDDADTRRSCTDADYANLTRAIADAEGLDWRDYEPGDLAPALYLCSQGEQGGERSPLNIDTLTDAIGGPCDSRALAHWMETYGRTTLHLALYRDYLARDGRIAPEGLARTPAIYRAERIACEAMIAAQEAWNTHDGDETRDDYGSPDDALSTLHAHLSEAEHAARQGERDAMETAFERAAGCLTILRHRCAFLMDETGRGLES